MCRTVLCHLRLDEVDLEEFLNARDVEFVDVVQQRDDLISKIAAQKTRGVVRRFSAVKPRRRVVCSDPRNPWKATRLALFEMWLWLRFILFLYDKAFML